MIRLYAPLRAAASFVQVGQGAARALAANGRLAGFYPIDAASEDDHHPGASAEAALLIGSPQTAIEASVRHGEHQRAWLLLAPNSDGIPRDLIVHLKRAPLHGLLAPSAWARDVLLRVHERVLVAPHGVDQSIYRPNSGTAEGRVADYQNEQFRVLHITSSLRQRKGTAELLHAWKLCLDWSSIPTSSTLAISANPLHVMDVMRAAEDAGVTSSVRVLPGFTFTKEQVAEVYRHAHLVCQPSRGEGFGLVPLEARACGTPVVMTAATGHSEHAWWGTTAREYGFPLVNGVVMIKTGSDEPIDDYLGASAPSLAVEDIAIALGNAHAAWLELHSSAQKHAAAVGQEWAWEKTMQKAIEQM